MIGLLQRLKERKLVQWGLAYLAGAWVVLQVLDLLAGTYGWPPLIMRSLPVLLAGGFLAALVLAWYHGEQGRQRATGMELAVLTVIFGAAGVGLGWIQRGSPTAGVPEAWRDADPRSVAVLPFANPGQDPADEYLGDGIAEEILEALARVPGLRVSARTSSFHFKNRDLPIRDIARELGVALVLEGSVRRTGDTLRISARLADASDFQRWSQTYVLGSDSVFAVQAEIARTVASELETRLSPGGVHGQAGAPPSTAAHDLYLQGLFHWNIRTTLQLQRAIALFEEAIRLEPGYGRAHAGLALAWSVVHLQARDIPAADALSRAEEAGRRALELDPELAEAHAALAYAYYWQWRWTEALASFERAVALNPNYSTARQWYGEVLAQMGRGAEAEAQLRQAVALDPLSLAAHGNLGLILLINGRWSEAIAQLEATLRMDPGYAFPLVLLHRLYLGVGRFDDARTVGRRWAELTGIAPAEDFLALVDAVADTTRRQEGRDVLVRWEAATLPRWEDIAYYHVKLGQHERALDALEHALEERAPLLPMLQKVRYWDPLRGSPRFMRIIRMLDVPDTAA